MLTEADRCLEQGSWQEALGEELAKPYIEELAAFVKQERESGAPVYPPEPLVFAALNAVPFHEVKVVVIGQDPYHGPGQAHGLSFSVPRGMPIPPSLRNIYKELGSDLQLPPPSHGCLQGWAQQGVLLLNTTLTVREGAPGSHAKAGWERLTGAIVDKLCSRQEPLVFMLWGKPAQQKVSHIIGGTSDEGRHFVLSAPHPSPLSAHRGFLGCRHFSQANSFLVNSGRSPIDWRVD